MHKIKFDKNYLPLFIRFVKLLLPYRTRWLAILFLSGFASILGLVNPYLTKLVIDKAIGSRDLRLFAILALIGAAIFVMIGVLNGFKRYFERYVKLRVKLDLNRRLFNKINHLSFNWFQDKSTGEHIYKISHDVNRVEDLVTSAPPQVAVLFPRLIVIFFIILSLNWKMALFSVCLAPFLYLPPYYFMKKRRTIWKRLIKNSEHIFKVLHENFSHIYLVKIFGKEDSGIRKYLRVLIGNIRIELDSARFEIFNNFAARAVDRIIIALIAFYGGYQVIKGRMTLGSLTAIMVYLGQLVSMQGTFIHLFQTIALGLVSCQRVADVLDEKEHIAQSPEARTVLFKKGEIVFKGVSFGYLPGKAILKDLSFAIKQGSCVSIAAPSGYGKTTLLNLIVRLYDPWQGEILIDGHRIKDIKISSLRSQIGMALQEPFLFNDTIRNNIVYGRQDANDEEVIEAARFFLVDDFAKDMTYGYDTVIGENACKISEGQKQKIAIARALIRKPRILILDEAMSSMDSASEEKILSNIKDYQKDIILITVSHRLSTAMSADLVYFLKGPDELIIGSCRELLQRDKEFYGLFKNQISNSVLI